MTSILYNQVGFIPEKQSCFNICKLINVMHHINKSQERNHIISLDTEKVFDKVQHAFMTEILGSLEIDGTYTKIIKAISNKPQPTLY